MSSWKALRSFTAICVVTFVVAIVCIGCRYSSSDSNDNGGNSGPPVNDNETGPGSVRIVLRNASPAAVETQFYATDEPLAKLPDDLLVSTNLVLSGIGVGGTGLLPPLSTDELELACSDTLTLGTAGGQFVEADLGTPLGKGEIRFMQAGYQFDCGATIIVEYSQTLGGYAVSMYADYQPTAVAAAHPQTNTP